MKYLVETHTKTEKKSTTSQQKMRLSFVFLFKEPSERESQLKGSMHRMHRALRIRINDSLKIHIATEHTKTVEGGEKLQQRLQ